MLYYTAPEDYIFNEVKQRSKEVWESLNAHPSYTEEKLSAIQDLPNVQDNLMYMVAMFDLNNQIKLSIKLSNEAREAIKERLIEGGSPLEFIVF